MRIEPVSFDSFVRERYPVGLGASRTTVEKLIHDDAEALFLWTKETKRGPGNPTGANQHTGNRDNITVSSDTRSKSQRGTSKKGGLLKLEAAAEGNAVAADQLALMKTKDPKTGKPMQSVNGACVATGLRKRASPPPDQRDHTALRLAEILAKRLSPAEIDLFDVELPNTTAKALRTALAGFGGTSPTDAERA